MKDNLAQIFRAPLAALDITRDIFEACAEAKARDIAVLDVTSNFSLADYFVIASGRSDRQVQGITNKILDTLEKRGMTPLSIEGLEEGQWVLIDFGEIVVHVFYEPVRLHYDLESLWNKAKKVELDTVAGAASH